MDAQQFDLFASGGVAPGSASATAAHPQVAAAELSDAALIEAIPYARRSDCAPLTDEAARRGLHAAVPAMEALCRRFKGFGLQRAVPEQAAALCALATLGGAEATAAVRRLIAGAAVQGPGLREAARAAATLRCRLPEDAALAVLRHADPDVRADACRCVPHTAGVAAVLLELLADLHAPVALAAACALGRMERAEARPALLRALRTAPTAPLIEAVAQVADDEAVVLLGRVAQQRPELRDAARAVLEELDTPRAEAVLRRLNVAQGAGEVLGSHRDDR